MSSVYRHQKNHQPQTFPLNKKRILWVIITAPQEKKICFYFKLDIIIRNLSQKVNPFYKKIAIICVAYFIYTKGINFINQANRLVTPPLPPYPLPKKDS